MLAHFQKHALRRLREAQPNSASKKVWPQPPRLCSPGRQPDNRRCPPISVRTTRGPDLPLFQVRSQFAEAALPERLVEGLDIVSYDRVELPELRIELRP